MIWERDVPKVCYLVSIYYYTINGKTNHDAFNSFYLYAKLKKTVVFDIPIDEKFMKIRHVFLLLPVYR